MRYMDRGGGRASRHGNRAGWQSRGAKGSGGGADVASVPIHECRCATVDRKISPPAVSMMKRLGTPLMVRKRVRVLLGIPGHPALAGEARHAAHGMPDFVQEGGYPIGASGDSGADADGAVDRGVRDYDP